MIEQNRDATVEIVARLCEELRHDLLTAGIEGSLKLYDLGVHQWIGESGRLPEEFYGAGLVLQTPTADHYVDLDDDLDSELVAIASVVQDWAVEMLWRGWPTDSGGRVLEPRLSTGRMVWSNREAHVEIPVGSLEGLTA